MAAERILPDDEKDGWRRLLGCVLTRQGCETSKVLSCDTSLRRVGLDPHLSFAPLHDNLCNIQDLQRLQ
jgi:hypothetical protein